MMKHLIVASALAVFVFGCSTTEQASMDNENSHLKCLGYCELVITDENTLIKAQVDIEEIENER